MRLCSVTWGVSVPFVWTRHQMRAGGARDGLDVIEMFIFCSLTSALTLALTFSRASTLDGGGEKKGKDARDDITVFEKRCQMFAVCINDVKDVFRIYTGNTPLYLFIVWGETRLDSCTIPGLFGFCVKHTCTASILFPLCCLRPSTSPILWYTKPLSFFEDQLQLT